MNLKDRLSIRLDNDMRKGLVQFDSWVMSTKVLFQEDFALGVYD